MIYVQMPPSGKLADAERWKRAENALDAYARLTTHAGEGAWGIAYLVED